MDPLIRARGLVKRYGGRTVVKGIDLDIHPNEVVALIGPNGAGKTTTLEMILGLRPPDGGSVAYWCEDPRKHLGVQLQATPFFPALTAAENLQLIAAFYGMPSARRNEGHTAAVRACGGGAHRSVPSVRRTTEAACHRHRPRSPAAGPFPGRTDGGAGSPRAKGDSRPDPPLVPIRHDDCFHFP